MSTPPPAAPPSSNNLLKVILLIVGAVVIVLCVIPVCVIAILALLGPQIGNIFSRVTSGTGGEMIFSFLWTVWAGLIEPLLH